uniref:Hydantoinase B/oxoprolinase n=1 Tax=Candidatus Kentrum sp. UNK TaxID=2126344 RepID=A0A451AEV5_9GAMM|nr:MAG: Hydantoinase B/oxoprolinase [Candidatus Kentron sp. UNK]VFK71143.1 MAG: Hydantoinase B/oxoprolinase [Candidatus Kentron sp. UNK]
MPGSEPILLGFWLRSGTSTTGDDVNQGEIKGSSILTPFCFSSTANKFRLPHPTSSRLFPPLPIYLTSFQIFISLQNITDPEILEQRFPVLLEKFAIRKGSGGAGRFPGGDGVVRKIRFLEPLSAGILQSSQGPALRHGGGRARPGWEELGGTSGWPV